MKIYAGGLGIIYVKYILANISQKIYAKYILIEGPESRTGQALENAYKYCPSGNVTRQISKSEN